MGEVLKAPNSDDVGSGASLRQIAAKLEGLGVAPNNGGTKWYAQSVKQILTSRITSELKAIPRHHIGIQIKTPGASRTEDINSAGSLSQNFAILRLWLTLKP